MAQINLPVHSYRLNSVTASNARLINCYAEPLVGKQPIRLTRAPGIPVFSTPTSGAGRGLHVMAGVLYAVVGSTLYSISSSGVATSIGTIAGTLPCWMANNGTQLAIGSDGGTWYVYNGSSLAAISDGDFTSRGARGSAFIDNYIAFVEPSSGRWFVSDLANATSYDALNFATAEGHPDRTISLIVDHREVILFGENTTEIWYNAGLSGFPFERSPDGLLELGGVANLGQAKLDNSVFWLASDLTVRRLEGRTPQRVSHHGVEERIRGYDDVSDCQAYPYTFNGHLCVVFRFPSAGETWVYDITTQEWHERQSYGYTGWNVSGVAECYGKVMVQDSLTGEIGYFDNETYTEFGEVQRAEWTYQNVYGENSRLFFSSLEIVAETGVGLATGQGSDPQLTLEVSDDGGRTWRTLPTRTIGAQGEYKTRVRWHRLGQSRDRVYRASISDPVELSVTDTVLTLA